MLFRSNTSYAPGQTRIFVDPNNQNKLTFQDGSTIVTLDQLSGTLGGSASLSYPQLTGGSSSLYLNNSGPYTGGSNLTYQVEIDTLGVPFADLSSMITTSDATINVSSTSGPPLYNGVYLIIIDNEKIACTGTASGPTRFTGCSRGQYGTYAQSHTSGTSNVY